MKRNLLALSAVVLAIAFSSFSKTTVTQYFRYRGTGDQFLLGSYFAPQSNQPTQMNGSGILNWIKVDDDNGTVNQTEFSAASTSYDTNSSSSLNDEANIAGALDKKTP